jgi:molybdopterin-guanine dinucleotide biosynthesis protein A
LLVVLAIDLPEMNAAFLKNLLARCSPTCGVVARNAEFFEPLAAIYPKSLYALTEQHLRTKRFAMQGLLVEAVRQGWLQEFPLSERDVPLFKNLNSPDDLRK